MLQAWLESIRALLQQMVEPQQMQPVRIKVEEQHAMPRKPARRRR